MELGFAAETGTTICLETAAPQTGRGKTQKEKAMTPGEKGTENVSRAVTKNPDRTFVVNLEPQQVSKGAEQPDQNIQQFQGLKIRRSTFLNYMLGQVSID